MGTGESTAKASQLFLTHDWDANYYFRNLFTRGQTDVKFNMKCTIHNLFMGGYIQKDANY